jgi:hypothetical protein
MGALVVLDLLDPSAGRVAVRRYRVAVAQQQQQAQTQQRAGGGRWGGLGGGGSGNGNGVSLPLHPNAPPVPRPALQARFSASSDLLYVLLPRELLVFDLEMGAPVASTALPAARPALRPSAGAAAAAAAAKPSPPPSPSLSGAPFSHLLAVFGCGVTLGSGDAGGTDFFLAAHSDGTASLWRRQGGSLRYAPARDSWPLCPPPGGMQGGSGSQGSQAPAMVAACAAVVVSEEEEEDDDGEGVGDRQGVREGEGEQQQEQEQEAEQADPPPPPPPPPPSSTARPPRLGFLAAAVSSDGRCWLWEQRAGALPPSLAAPRYYPSASPASASRSSSSIDHAPPPQLLGVAHGLPSPAVAVAWHPRPVALTPPPQQEHQQPQLLTPLAAAVTADGSLALMTLTRGAAQALEAEVVAEASVHPPLQAAVAAAAAADAPAAQPSTRPNAAAAALSRAFGIGISDSNTTSNTRPGALVARGVRWLGDSPFLVVFSCERAAPPAPGAGASGSSSAAVAAAAAAAAAAGGTYNNRLSLVDARSRACLPFRVRADAEQAPLVAVSASPSGAHLLLRFRGAPAELWVAPACVVAAIAAGAAGAEGAGLLHPASPPVRLRLLDLPFSAAEWALPNEGEAVAGGGALHTRQPPSWCWGEQRGGGTADAATADDFLGAGGQGGDGNEEEDTQAAAAAALAHDANDPSASLPEERLAFALRDGRCGILSVRGRKVADTKPHRLPYSSSAGAELAGGPLGAGSGGGAFSPRAAARAAAPPDPDALPALSLRPGDFVATAVAAVGRFVLLGDARGAVVAWDTISGASRAVASGLSGGVAAIVAGPPLPPLAPSSSALAALSLVASPRQSLGGGGGDPAPPRCRVRAAVLSASGDFGVLEVDEDEEGQQQKDKGPAMVAGSVSVPRLRLGSALQPGARSSAGAAAALAWVPLPLLRECGAVASVAGGAILSAATADGGVALLDAMSPLPPSRHPHHHGGNDASVSRLARVEAALSAARRARAFRALASAAPLPAPPPLLPASLLPRAPILLLRLMMQLGTPLAALDALAASSPAAAAASMPPIASLLPTEVQRALASPFCLPRRSGSGFLGSSAAAVAMLSPRPSVDGGGGAAAGLDSAAAAAAAIGSPPPTHSAPALAVAAAIAAVAQLRGGQLLLPAERRAYAAALRPPSQGGGAAARMAAAARAFGGDGDGAEEWRWWRLLPATLAAVKAGGDSASSSDHDAGLWPAALALAECRERAAWRDALPPPAPPAKPPSVLSPLEAAAVAAAAEAGDRAALAETLAALSPTQAAAAAAYADAFADADARRERRLLDLVACGDLQAAVAFLLLSADDASSSSAGRQQPRRPAARFYRAAVQAMALGASASLAAQGSGGGNGGGADAAALTLHLQAAKLVGATAAAAGDGLLRAVLDASAGLDAEACAALQDAGLWSRAAALCARALPPGSAARGRVLRRWAMACVPPSAASSSSSSSGGGGGAGGGPWRAAGLLAAGGCLREAREVLGGAAGACRPDAARAFAEACAEAGLAGDGGLGGGGGGGGEDDGEPFARHVLAVLQLLL